MLNQGVWGEKGAAFSDWGRWEPSISQGGADAELGGCVLLSAGGWAPRGSRGGSGCGAGGDPLRTGLSWGAWLRVAPLPQPGPGWASLLPPEEGRFAALSILSSTPWSSTTAGASCGDCHCLWETAPGSEQDPPPPSTLGIAGLADTSQPFHTAKLPSAAAAVVAWGSLRRHP